MQVASNEYCDCSYGEALGQLRECMKVYSTTLLLQLVGVSEVEVLKRIYFLSG